MPDESTATLSIRRDPELSGLRRLASRDRFRAYTVVVDGEKVGRLRTGEVREFLIAPGRHSLRVAIDYSGSEEIECDLPVGGKAAFVCGPAGSPLSVWQAFTRHRWVRLAQEPATTPSEMP